MGSTKNSLLLVLILALPLLSLQAYAQQSLTISPGTINPGASALITYTNDAPAYTGTASCDTSNVVVEISAADQPCDTNVISLMYNNGQPPNVENNIGYCDVDAADQPVSPGVNYPYPPCLLPSPAKSSPGTCTENYYTNHTLAPGVYNICSYANIGGAWYPSYNAILNVTTSAIEGYNQQTELTNTVTLPGFSYGLKLAESSPTVSIEGTGAPYTNYFTSTGQSNPGSSTCASSDFTCYMELAGANAVNFSTSGGAHGCVSPLGLSSGTSYATMSYCSTSSSNPTGDTPCLLTPTSPGTYSFSGYSGIPSGNYLLCAYAYATGVSTSYPSGSAKPFASLDNRNPLIAPFFASANFICNTSGCTPINSINAEPVDGVPTPVIGFGYISFNAPSAIQGNAIAVGFVSEGAIEPPSAAQTPLYVYVSNMVTPLNALTSFNPSSICLAPPANAQNINTACNAGAGLAGQMAGSGCYYSYSLGPGTACTGSGGTSCVAAPDGGYPDAQSEEVNTLGITPPSASDPTESLQAGNYVFCGVYDLGSPDPHNPAYEPPTYVAAGILTITSPVPPGQLGASNPITLAPIDTAICYIYGQLNGVLVILALVLIILGAVIYAGAHVLPPSQAGIAQGYGIGMVIAGAVGALMAVSALTIISIATNTPVTQISAACQVVPSNISSISTSTSTSTSTTTTSTSTTTTTTTTTSTTTSSTICQTFDTGNPSGSSPPWTYSGSDFYLTGEAQATCYIIVEQGDTLYTNGYNLVAGDAVDVYGDLVAGNGTVEGSEYASTYGTVGTVSQGAYNSSTWSCGDSCTSLSDPGAVCGCGASWTSGGTNEACSDANLGNGRVGETGGEYGAPGGGGGGGFGFGHDTTCGAWAANGGGGGGGSSSSGSYGGSWGNPNGGEETNGNGAGVTQECGGTAQGAGDGGGGGGGEGTNYDSGVPGTCGSASLFTNQGGGGGPPQTTSSPSSSYISGGWSSGALWEDLAGAGGGDGGGAGSNSGGSGSGPQGANGSYGVYIQAPIIVVGCSTCTNSGIYANGENGLPGVCFGGRSASYPSPQGTGPGAQGIWDAATGGAGGGGGGGIILSTSASGYVSNQGTIEASGGAGGTGSQCEDTNDGFENEGGYGGYGGTAQYVGMSWTTPPISD